MRLINLVLTTYTLLATSTLYAQTTKLDQYLLQQGILSSDYKINKKKSLNEILNSLSHEDARVMPYQLDQNILLKTITFESDEVKLTGEITTPDFSQFINEVGEKTFQSMIQKNLISSCNQLFEHQFQKVNAYQAELKLSSPTHHYTFRIKNTECNF